MQVIAAIAGTWIEQGRVGVVARVIGADGLGPRPSGDLLIVDANGRTGGSLLAGSVQPEVIEAAQQLLRSSLTHSVTMLGIEAADAIAAGLTCGGAVEILVQRLDVIPHDLWATLGAGRPAALVTVLGDRADDHPQSIVVHPGGSLTGSLGESGLDALAQSEAEALLAHAGPGLNRVGVGDVELVIEAWNPAPRLLIVGASDLATALTRQVELLGWTATTAVGADAALEAVQQLNVSDMLVVIDHAPSVATPALAAALRAGVGYVGALGSRRTQEVRRRHLVDYGLRDVEIQRLHGPTGLDIGSRTPAETAVSIVAEVIASRSERTGAPLTTSTGRISG